MASEASPPSRREVLLNQISFSPAGDSPDPKTKEEQLDLETARKKAELEGLKQDIDERRKYANKFFVLSCVWIGVITLLLLLQGFGALIDGRFPFKLSDAILLAVIGSTTVNVLGFLYVVANYLFPKR